MGGREMICPICGFKEVTINTECASCGTHITGEWLPIETTGTLSISGLEKIEPLNPRNVSSEYWNATHENRAKLNEVIEKLNLVMDYLNKGVK
jgi:uncharacterized Zn finger protein (UPF0148 family)